MQCRYALLGDFLDYEELRLALLAVARTSAEARSFVLETFGGVRGD